VAGRRGHVFLSRKCKQPYIEIKKNLDHTRLEVPCDAVTLNSETGINVNQASKVIASQLALLLLL
jgi:hypothetical protein